MTNNNQNYNASFQITENIGNNIFCFDKLENPKIYVPSLIQINIKNFKANIDNYLKIWKNISFREEKKGEIIEYKWLENFIQINTDISPSLSKKGIGDDLKQTIYIIDNHNHALYFRYKEYFNWNIQKSSKLIHIDQHTDMNQNKYKISLSPVRGEDRSEVIFNFTNKNCNVWNFIKPAIAEWLLWEITQINTEYSLLNNKFPPLCWKHKRGDREDFMKTKILDIDLDFRAPEMTIEKYNQTIKITKNLIQNSRVVTIATSPYFLDQNLAIKILKDLFK